MRPIIGVNSDCLPPHGVVCHPTPSLPAPRSHGKLRRRLTGTGVGSSFRFVSDLAFGMNGQRKPAIAVVCPVWSVRMLDNTALEKSQRKPKENTILEVLRWLQLLLLLQLLLSSKIELEVPRRELVQSGLRRPSTLELWQPGRHG